MKKFPVLILDDDPDIHNLLKLEFKDSIFEPIFCTQSEEAIVELGNREFAFALIDIILGPGKTSESVIEFIKKDISANNHHLPVAVMSGYMDDEYARKIRMKGPNVVGTIKKPFKPKEVLNFMTGQDKSPVLVLDDDTDILGLVTRDLEKGGYSCFSTPSPKHAKTLCLMVRFQAAIIDNKIGQGDSKDFLDFLEKNEIPIPVILTGKNIEKENEERDGIAVFDAIQKPFKPGDFSRSLKKLEQWQGQDFNIGTVEDPLEAEQLIKGQDEQREEAQFISGEDFVKNLESFLIKGDEEEGEANTLVKGSKEDLAEESTTIKGSGPDENENDFKTVISGSEEIDIPEVQKKTHIDQRNAQGMTPLMVYAYTGNIDVVENLLESGANVGLKSLNGKTPLHYAAHSGNLDLVKLLMDKGLKINARDEKQREPLYDAIISNQLDLVKFFVEKGARLNCKIEGKNYLFAAAKTGNIDLNLYLLDAGISPDEKDYNGNTVLDMAIRRKNKELYEMLKMYSKSNK